MEDGIGDTEVKVGQKQYSIGHPLHTTKDFE